MSEKKKKMKKKKSLKERAILNAQFFDNWGMT